MSQKIKAPNSKGGGGFVWAVLAIIAIVAVVIAAIFFIGKDKNSAKNDVPQEDVSFNVSQQGDDVVLASDKVKQDAPTVDIFEDFSCPHCADLSKVDNEDIRKALDEGKIKVHYKFLNFLDQQPGGSSTRGASVALALAKTGDAKAFWNMHNFMMDQQKTCLLYTSPSPRD